MRIIKNFVLYLFCLVFLTINFCPGSIAGTRSYNINVLLGEPHPFSELSTDPNTAEFRNKPVPKNNIHTRARIPEFQSPPQSSMRPALQGNKLAPDIVIEPRRPVIPLWETPGKKIISELRLGFLAHDHDIAPFSRSEEDGIDANFEVLFVSPSWLKNLRSPRPHLGLSVNANGDTSQAYAGLTWEWRFWRKWFFDFSLGGAIHNGKTKTTLIDRKELGCQVLFRESLDLGYIFAERHSISAFMDHISNANICEKNEGLETVGIRYGYRF
ncbi:MAG: hypothetical protein CMM75_10065 [Rhodospirillaceae bacterium]|nr:hypothetical protein [Rhodospirillaceae bacterium]